MPEPQQSEPNPMNITLTLTDEQTDALNAKVAERNALKPAKPYTDDDLFDNYTIAQVVAALRAYGLLA